MQPKYNFKSKTIIHNIIITYFSKSVCKISSYALALRESENKKMALGAVELGLALLGLLLVIYYYLTMTHNYWASRGIKGPKPIPLCGTFKDMVLQKYCIDEYLHVLYKDWKSEPLLGIYFNRKPGLVVHDLDLVKNVLIKDFSKFGDRGSKHNKKFDRLSLHLINMDVKPWRPVRLKLSTIFTTGKLKETFQLLIDCAEQMNKYLDKRMNDPKGVVIDVGEMAARFTTDVIGVCVLGLQMNTLMGEESIFRNMGRRAVEFDWKAFINYRLMHFMPELYNMVGSLFVDTELENFLINMSKQLFEYRTKNGIVKHDLVDILMNLRDNPDQIPEIELSEAFLTSQLFVFFAAGFQTSAMTISNALYALAQDQKIQEKLKDEIKKEMETTGGVLEFERIQNLEYLDMVFQETLRMYPAIGILTRRATEPYTFKTSSNTKLLTIDKDQKIWIPVYAILRDPNYFPEPDVFNPERFAPEAIKSRNPMTYLPFGDGPRSCIGKKFATIQTKVGIVKILHHYTVDICEKTQIPYVYEPKSFLMLPKNGIHLKITKDINCS